MSQKPLSILISGAGIAGSSLALTLARCPGFKIKPRITLLERSPVPRTTGQAVDVRGPGVDVIRKIGLEPEIKARHTSETGIAFMNAKGEQIAKFDSTGDAKNQSVTSEYEILRGEMAALLLDHVNEAKENGTDVQIVYGESIESIEEQVEGVNVKFTNGKVEPQSFDVVVGTDGIASRTRAMIFGEEDHRDHVKPSGMYLGFFTIPRVAEDDDLWRCCNVPQGMGMHLRPHRNKTTMGVYLTITNGKKAPIPELDEILHKDVPTQKAYLTKRFRNAGWQSERLLAGLEATDDFYMTHWCAVRTPKWTKGRCAILGDSAFATMGVGTSWAMVGAYIMAGELAKVSPEIDVPKALQNYEAALRPGFSKDDKAPPGVPQLANPQTALGVSILQTILKATAISRLDKLLMRFFGGEDKNEWKVPDYGWENVQS